MIATAVASDTADRPTTGGSCRNGNRSTSSVRPTIAFTKVTAAWSRRLRDVPEPLQLLFDLRLAVALLDRGDLLLEDVRHELVDRRVAGEIGAALHLRHERLVERDSRSKEHGHLPAGK